MLSLKNRPVPEATISELLEEMAIDSNYELVSAELEKHPDYPSLLSISDVLTTLKIENVAMKVTFEELNKIPRPFVTHSSSDGGDFLVVNNVSAEHITATNRKRKKNILPEDFKRDFSGVVLVAEAASDKLRHNKLLFSSIKIKNFILSGMIIIIFTCGLVFQGNYFSRINSLTALLTAAKTIGLFTAILLLIESIDSNNPMVQVLCQTKGKTNCNAILSSKASSVFKWLSWSEVGFYYFSSTWLLLLFGSGSKIILSTICFLNLVSLPYTVYSIYYQSQIAKQWCILCCIVQLTLWLEFIPSVLIIIDGFTALGGKNLKSDLSSILISFLCPVVSWTLLKPLFLDRQKLIPIKEQLRKFKYNELIFNKLLFEQPCYEQPEKGWSIVLGNLEANKVITIVTNPYCQPCSNAHKILSEMLDQNDNIQVRVVFNAMNDDKDKKTPVSRHLMALNSLDDKSIVKKALDDWYDQKQKNYEEWSKIYPANVTEKEVQKLDLQKKWCKMAEVTFTPTILVNGYRLPDLYQLSDLRYMLK